MAVGQITSSPAPQPSPPAARQVSEKSKTLEDIRMLFPEDLDSLLGFEEKSDYIIIKPKQFLGSENFAKIASTVRGIGGEYISAGRDFAFPSIQEKSLKLQSSFCFFPVVEKQVFNPIEEYWVLSQKSPRNPLFLQFGESKRRPLFQ